MGALLKLFGQKALIESNGYIYPTGHFTTA